MNAAIIAAGAPSIALVSMLVYLGLEEHEPGFVTHGKLRCEYSNSSIFKEPNAAWTSLSYMIVGIACAMHASSAFGAPGSPANPTTRLMPVALLHTSFISWIGAMSIFYHGFATDWSAKLDGISMLALISLLLALAVLKIASRSGCLPITSRRAFYLAMSVMLAPKYVVDVVIINYCSDYASEIYLGCGIGSVILLEAIYTVLDTKMDGRRGCRCPSRPRHAWVFLLAGAALMAVGLAFWLLAREDCGLQGHPVWHSMSALAMACAYAYYALDESRAFPFLGGFAALVSEDIEYQQRRLVED